MSAEVPKLTPTNQISQEELKSRVDNDDVIVVDVRNDDEVARSGKIKAKRWLNIPYSELGEALKLSDVEFKAKFELSKMKEDGSDVVFHCGKGGRGTKATLLALEHGYNKCKHLEGGQSTWKRTFPDA